MGQLTPSVARAARGGCGASHRARTVKTPPGARLAGERRRAADVLAVSACSVLTQGWLLIRPQAARGVPVRVEKSVAPGSDVEQNLISRTATHTGGDPDPNADSILLRLDCGGSNSAARHIFKHDLQRMIAGRRIAPAARALS